MSKKITQQVWELAQPVVESFGLRLWDVEYVREGADWFLRLYIDKDGPVDINDCEKVSRAIDPLLDEKDPIPDSYSFEVCSAASHITNNQIILSGSIAQPRCYSKPQPCFGVARKL